MKNIFSENFSLLYFVPSHRTNLWEFILLLFHLQNSNNDEEIFSSYFITYFHCRTVSLLVNERK